MSRALLGRSTSIVASTGQIGGQCLEAERTTEKYVNSRNKVRMT